MKPIIFGLLLQILCCPMWSMQESKGLIFVVDKENINPSDKNNLDAHIFRIQCMALDSEYDRIYYAIGKDCRDDMYMRMLWQKANQENHILDYVSFVPAGDGGMKPACQIPYGTKLRMVYIEDTRDKEAFIKENKALMCTGPCRGHNKLVVCSFFCFHFLEAWLKGKSCQASLEEAGKKAQDRTLYSPAWSMIAQAFPEYNYTDEAIGSSAMECVYLESVDLENFTIFSSCALIDRDQTIVRRSDYVK